jgi:hypothetical protein
MEKIYTFFKKKKNGKAAGIKSYSMEFLKGSFKEDPVKDM